MKKQVQSHGISLKKKYGQHFLRDEKYIDALIQKIDIKGASIFEVGPGQGVLTRAILKKRVARLWSFEIDEEWVAYLKRTLSDKRFTVHYTNILDFDFSLFKEHAPWVVLANLPYQITFPLFHLFQKNKNFLQEGVVMVQEEVAQRIAATRGKSYGYVSLFFQHHFEWQLLSKVPASAFFPPPKVESRLLYFKPKKQEDDLFVSEKEEDNFWQFVKICFKQPRRTLRNNLQDHIALIECLSSEILTMRAQQLSFDDLYSVWKKKP